MMSKTDEGYRKIQLGFHLIILLFAIGIIISSLFGFREMERAPLYLILGLLFTAESIYGIFKNYNKRLKH